MNRWVDGCVDRWMDGHWSHEWYNELESDTKITDVRVHKEQADFSILCLLATVETLIIQANSAPAV